MLTSDIFKILRKQSAGINGEIQRAYASNVQVENGGVEAIMHVAKKLALI